MLTHAAQNLIIYTQKNQASRVAEGVEGPAGENGRVAAQKAASSGRFQWGPSLEGCVHSDPGLPSRLASRPGDVFSSADRTAYENGVISRL